MRKWESFSGWFLSPKATIRGSCHTHRRFTILSLCKAQVWFGFLSTWACGEGQAEGSQLQHSLLSYRCAFLSGSWQEGEELCWGESGPFLSGGGEGDGDCGHLEALRCWNAGGHPEYWARSQLSLFERPEVSLSPSVCRLSSWVIREH